MPITEVWIVLKSSDRQTLQFRIEGGAYEDLLDVLRKTIGSMVESDAGRRSDTYAKALRLYDLLNRRP